MRTNSTAVEALLLKDYDAKNLPSLSPFIESASSIVDDLYAYAVGNGRTISTVKLELIERWLSAHAYQQSDRGYTSRSTESASGSFQGSATEMLKSTFYGQMALTLDSTGYLMNIGKRKTVAYWAGKPTSEQIDIDQRN